MYNDPANSPGGHLELEAMDFKQSDNCFKLPVLIQRETGAGSYASSAPADNPINFGVEAKQHNFEKGRDYEC